MTGETPDKLRRLALSPSQKPLPIRIDKIEKGELKETEIGQGFSILETLSAQTEDGNTHSWKEQWFIVQSHVYANTQKKACLSRLEKAEAELERLKPIKNETAEPYRQRAEKILNHRKCKDPRVIVVDHEAENRFTQLPCVVKFHPRDGRLRSQRDIAVSVGIDTDEHFGHVDFIERGFSRFAGPRTEHHHANSLLP